MRHRSCLYSLSLSEFNESFHLVLKECENRSIRFRLLGRKRKVDIDLDDRSSNPEWLVTPWSERRTMKKRRKISQKEKERNSRWRSHKVSRRKRYHSEIIAIHVEWEEDRRGEERERSLNDALKGWQYANRTRRSEHGQERVYREAQRLASLSSFSRRAPRSRQAAVECLH